MSFPTVPGSKRSANQRTPGQVVAFPQSVFGTILIFSELQKEPSEPLPYRDGTHPEGIYLFSQVPSGIAPRTITTLQGSGFAQHIC